MSETKISLPVTLFSFGYKYGLPREVDEVNLLFDVRFLNNPFHVDELRPYTGRDDRISNFVLENGTGKACLKHLQQVIQFLAEQFEESGKEELQVAIGCTGGHHRSVAVIEALSDLLRSNFKSVTHYHRDIEKENH